MKAEILQENLSKALNITSRFVSSKMQLPVIANVLIHADKNKLTISATNLEMSVSYPVGAKVEESGDITIPARNFYEIISNLPLGPVKLETDKEKLKINSSGFDSTLLGISASEFPKLPHDGLPSKMTTVKNMALQQILSKTLFSVSQDETRPALTGALFDLQKEKLKVVSTDGFRLSLKEGIVENFVEDFSVIIPKNVLMEVQRIATEKDVVNFYFDKNENQIIFSVGSILVSSRIISGNFPEYGKIIPKSSEIEVDIDAEDLKRAVRLSSVFARDASNVLKFQIGSDQLEVSAESGKTGSQTSKVEAKVKNEGGADLGKNKLIIAFNYKYIEDFINIAEGDSVVIGFGNANSPAVFKDPKDPALLHIIMPIKLQE